jgi:hypothetical protein
MIWRPCQCDIEVGLDLFESLFIKCSLTSIALRPILARAPASALARAPRAPRPTAAGAARPVAAMRRRRRTLGTPVAPAPSAPAYFLRTAPAPSASFLFSAPHSRSAAERFPSATVARRAHRKTSLRGRRLSAPLLSPISRASEPSRSPGARTSLPAPRRGRRRAPAGEPHHRATINAGEAAPLPI